MSFMYLGWNKLPNVSTCIDNLGDLPRIAHMLKVDLKTVKRWHKAGQSPTAVHYAIFWCTVWGRSMLEEQVYREAQIQAMRAARLERENKKLEEQLSMLESRIEAMDLAANAPLRSYGTNPERIIR
jgi:hypothetical protein